MSDRVNSFGDLSDFAPKPRSSRPVVPSTIERVAADNNFPSRTPATASTQATRRPIRRHVTGRNQQLNIKATPETIDRFYKLADQRGMVLGELLECALDALERGA